MLEKSTAKVYEYPPTEKEAHRALLKQAEISFRFHTDPKMTVEEYTAKIETTLAPIKRSRRTEKYSLEELTTLAQNSTDKRDKTLHEALYKHEANHAKQIRRVIKTMAIEQEPEFVVYWCPIMADMYQCGKGIGLIETQGISNLTREKLIEFETRLTMQMVRTTENSVGDLYLIGALMLAKVIRFVKKG